MYIMFTVSRYHVICKILLVFSKQHFLVICSKIVFYVVDICP